MAEIVKWVTTTTESETGCPEVKVKTTGSVRVLSIKSSHPDVSVLRDLVHALDQADAPRAARVTLRSTDIVVEWSYDPCVVDEEDSRG